MSAVVVQDITVAGVEQSATFEVAAGTLTALLTSKQEINDLLVRLILGLAVPEEGRVTVLGSDPSKLCSAELWQLRRQVSVVHPSGGLVSNLKVWENLVLPLEYHAMCPPAEVEERGLAVLKRLNYEGRIMELPSPLPLYQKRLIGMGRAMLCDPELIIYNGVLSGVSETERTHLVGAALAFHQERPGRTTLFISSNPGSLGGIRFDNQIFLQREG